MKLLDFANCYKNGICPLCERSFNKQNQECTNCLAQIDKHNDNIVIRYFYNNLFITFCIYDFSFKDISSTYLAIYGRKDRSETIYNSWEDNIFKINDSTFDDLHSFINKLMVFK